MSLKNRITKLEKSLPLSESPKLPHIIEIQQKILSDGEALSWTKELYTIQAQSDLPLSSFESWNNNVLIGRIKELLHQIRSRINK